MCNRLYNSTAAHALTDPDLEGTVKLVYMDPPYNTGKKFNQYSDSAPVKEWLAMLEETLIAAKATMREDASVWVHLDDKYIHRVRCLMDDIFGEANYISTVIWEKKNRASFLNTKLSGVTDQILVYAKDKTQLAPFVSASTAVGKRVPVHHKGNPDTVLEFPAGCMSFNIPDQTVPKGEMNTRSIDSALLDDVLIENGRNVNAFRMSGPFRWGQEKIDLLVSGGGEFICPLRVFRPSFLSQDSNGKVMTNLLSFRINGTPTNEDARYEQEAIFGGTSFDTPKPERLIERIVAAATDEGDTVLDPFAGSGTTLAVSQKTGRNWVGVELSPKTIADYITPRLDGILAGTDPLPLEGYTASKEAYRVIVPPAAEEAAAALAA